MTQPTPFEFEWSADAIADLRERLARTRWPEAETVADWSQGVPLAYQREVCDYWADGYDFAAAQARLQRFPQFRHEVDGLGIHFLHLPSPHADAMPLVLTHGWPGTFVEFLDVIDALANPGDPADAFHVVVPSLPGYAYSDKPTAPGWNIPHIARAWDTLMGDLGYDRYGAQGGDWGAMVTTSIGQQCAEHVTGIHVNMPLVNFAECDMTDLTEREAAALRRVSASTPNGAWATPPSSRRARRPSATASPIPRPGSARGSSRSSGRGPTATVTPKARSPATTCSTTSPSTGSPRARRRRRASTGRASRR